MVVPAGAERIYVEREWNDALVVVARGEVELHAVDGRAATMHEGDVLCLHGLALRSIRNVSDGPAVLTAVRRVGAEGLEPPTAAL